MKISTTSVRLREVMQQQGLRQVDVLELARPLCVELGVKLGRNDLSQYLSGKVQPGRRKLALLSRALGVSEAWLMGFDVSMGTPSEQLLPLPRVYEVPLLGDIACGEPILAEQNITELVPVPESVKGADFALRCHGDSMTGARIFDGDIVYIRQQSDVENGQIAAVLIDCEATLKRVYRYPNKLILSPENPMYEPFVFTDDELYGVRILGRAIAFTSSIR